MMNWRCLLGRHAWQQSRTVRPRYFGQWCPRCRQYRKGPDGGILLSYLPMPLRQERRDLVRGLSQGIERRMKDDAMFTAAERDFAELQEQLNEP